jgi:hypothetical protein
MAALEETKTTTLEQLMVIAAIKEGDKLCVNRDIEIFNGDYMFQGLHRWIKAETRGKTIAFIRAVTGDALVICSEFPIDDLVVCRAKTRFFDECDAALTGLKNLERTYAADLLTVAKLRVIRENFQNGIVRVSHPDISQSSDEINLP